MRLPTFRSRELCGFRRILRKPSQTPGRSIVINLTICETPTNSTQSLVPGGVEMKRNIFVKICCATCLVLLTCTVAAQQVYRCKNASGSLEFSDAPCSSGRTGDKISVQPNTLDSSATREHLLRQENERLKEQLRLQESSMRQSAPVTAPQRSQGDLQAERIDTIECTRARRDYEVTASSSGNSRAIVEAKKSAMYGVCGMREPNQTNVNVNNRITVVR